MTRPGRLPAEFQEQFSFAAEIFQTLNSLSVPLTGAAAKPFFLDSFLNIRALCKWNKKEKKEEVSVFAGLGETISRPLVCFPFAEVFRLVFYSAAAPLILTNARPLCRR